MGFGQLEVGWKRRSISEAPTQRIRNEKCASSEGWHEQWVKVPPEQESKAP